MSNTWRIVVVVVAAGVVIEAVFLVAIMRQVGTLLLAVGPSKPIDLPGGPHVGAVKNLPGYENGRPALVLFTSPGCPICDTLTPGFRRMHAEYGSQLDVVAVVSHPDAQSRAEHARELGTFARTDLPALMQDWDIPGTPYGVALSAGRQVRGAGIVNTLDQLETLAVVALGVEPVPPEGSEETGATPALVIEHADADRSPSKEVLA
jgi:thiol-disulfide isomerase/thioredoxin